MRKIKFSLLGLLFLLLLNSALADSNTSSTDEWLMSGRTLDNNRYYPGRINLNGFTKLFDLDLNFINQYVYPTPTIFDDFLILGSGFPDSHLYAVNLTTFEIIWKLNATKKFGSTQFTSGAISENSLIIGDANGFLYKLNLTNGNQIWNFSTNKYRSSALRGSPIIYDDIVLFGGCDEDFYAINFSDGNQIWNYTNYSIYDRPIRTTPIIYEDIVVFGINQTLRGRNYTDGEYIWHYNSADYITMSPVRVNNTLFFSDVSNRIYALNLSEIVCANQLCVPNQIWNITLAYDSELASDGNYLYAASGDSMVAINISDGSIIWSTSVSVGNSLSAPVITEISVWTSGVNVNTDANILLGLDKKTGNIIFNDQTSSNMASNSADIAIVNNILYFGIMGGIRAYSSPCLDLSDGLVVTESLMLNSNCTYNFTSSGAILFNLSTSNVILDCNGATIKGANISQDQRFAYIGLSSYTSNITIKNCNLINFSFGISIDRSSENNYIYNNNFTDFIWGIHHDDIFSGTEASSQSVSIKDNNFVSINPYFNNIGGINLVTSIEVINNTINVSGDAFFTDTFTTIYNSSIMNNVFYSSFGSSVWSNTVTPLQNVTFSNNHFYDNFSVNDVIFRTNYPYDVIFYNNSFYDSSVNLTKNIFGDNLMGTFCHNGIGNYYYDGAWGKYCPPTISLNSPSNNFNSPNSEINFSITVSDQNDDYLDCNVSLNGTAIVNFSANIQGQTSTFKNISDGIYLWNISCINENSDNVISETRNLEIDSFPPKVPNVTSISQSGNIATLEWNPIVKNVIGESEVDNIIYQIWYGTSINMSKDNISETLTFLKDVNSNTTTYSVTSTDRYYFVITTKDVTGNQNLSFGNGTLINVSLTYTAPVTPPSNDDSGDSGSSGSSGSSSSGGGSSGYVAPPKIEDEKVFIEIKLKVKANESVNFSVKKPEISIKEIKIVSKEDKSKISIKVSKKDEIKIKVKPKNSFAIYEYLEITPELIEDDEIGNATINFEINTTWLEENRFSKNKVMLLRNHNDTWQELVTHLLSEADGLVHYEAITPGFSEFAIAANLEEEKTIILDDIATEIIEEPKEEEKLITETNHKNYWLYGGIGLTIIGIIVTLFIFNKKDFEK